MSENRAVHEPSTLLQRGDAGQSIYRYSGGRNESNEQDALAKLSEWIGQKQLKITGEPLFGYYDPPWIPSFLRRNEVMLRIAGTRSR